jgi:hypothetical protein
MTTPDVDYMGAAKRRLRTPPDDDESLFPKPAARRTQTRNTKKGAT